MSNLSELRQRLHADVEMLAGAAAIEALDNWAMRSAIIDALEIYERSNEPVTTGEWSDGVTSASKRQSAAHEMAERLKQLHHAPGRNIRAEAGLEES